MAARLRASAWPRRLALALIGLLVVWALAYALVPWILKSQIQKIASEKLGRQVTLGAVDFKPWSLEAALTDLAIAKATPVSSTTATTSTTPQLSIKRIYINAELQSLLRLAPVFNALEVDEPSVSLTHLGGGRYDIDDVLARLQPAADLEAADKPQRFALYNVQLRGGQMDFVDQPAGKTHQLRALDLAVPFLSNLPSKVEITTSPRLAFKLNGSAFDSAAEGTPFAQTRKTDATIKLAGFDLAPYLAYVPESLPFKLESAVLNLDVRVFFEQTPDSAVRISGWATADKVRLVEKSAIKPAAREVLAFDQLRVTLSDLQPLAQSASIAAIELTAPTLSITRDRAGQLNLLPSVSNPVYATKTIAKEDRQMGATGTFDVKNAENAQTASLPASAASPPQSSSSASVANAQKDEKTTTAAAGSGISSPANAASSPRAAAAAKPAASPWKIQVDSVAVRGGRIHWLDETLASPATIRLADFRLDASTIALPFVASAPLKFSASLGLDTSPLIDSAKYAKSPVNPPVKSVAKPVAKVVAKAVAAKPPAASPQALPASLTLSGTATDQSAQISATVAAWPLNMAAKYIGQFLLPALNGQLDAQLAVDWKAANTGQPDKADKTPNTAAQTLKISAPQIALRDVQLAQGKVSLVSVKQVALSGVDIDVAAQTFSASNMQLSQPKAIVERDGDKRWMYERWLADSTEKPPADSAAKESKESKESKDVKEPKDGKTPPSWAVAIKELALDGGSIAFSDKAGSKPVAFEVSSLQARLNGLVLDDRPASKALAAKTMPLNASLRLSAGRFEPGKLDFKGVLGLLPLQAQGQMTVDRLPVQAFEPYFADALNVELLRADASFKGRVAYRQTPAGPAAQVLGDVALEEFKANSLLPSEDLLAWKALNLRGLKVALEPAKATEVDVRETVLTDFFARVIVTPEGRINLQDLLKPAATDAGLTSAATVSSTASATKSIAIEARQTGARGQNDVKNAIFGQTEVAATPPIIRFGPISLINGKVRFSDRFVKPNYSADLTDLTGKLSAFSSVTTTGTPNMADLELRGRAEGTASLEILGKLNPLAKPLALDITGKVRDLELPPLSPYSVKYSGYGIQRGKLSVDVNYVVLPNGQLTAKNKVVLSQLSFGDKVAGSTASLPVKLAVALLADRNGVIDLDLPISGSLNDPQFSLGPIIVKVIINVIVKAITAPFSLLASALGGGGEELSTVGFAAGSAELAPAAKAGLDKVAKALTDRPSLRLTVVGSSSLDAERDGFKQERLADMLRAEKRRSMVKDGDKTTATLIISAAEQPALLKEVYKRADMPKPRNAIGISRDLPPEEMEKLLLAHISVSEDAMRELAVQRGVAVKDYLASRSLPLERLFLGAAKAVPPEAKWTPRAELQLASP